MASIHMYSETDLAALAKKFREARGMTKAAIARELGVSRATIQDAEERPQQSLTKLRIRIIEFCSPYTIKGPAFWMKKK